MVFCEEGEITLAEAISCLPSDVIEEAIWDRDTKALKSRPRNYGSAGNPRISASGSHRTKAFFIGSSDTSSGTGVFIPHRVGNSLKPSERKPACSPVILPARVVEALGLHIQEFGLRVPRTLERKAVKSSNPNINQNAAARKSVESLPRDCLRNIVFPEGWIYSP